MKSLNRPTTYMPGLDGLRAFAVTAVILYHLSLPGLTRNCWRKRYVVPQAQKK